MMKIVLCSLAALSLVACASEVTAPTIEEDADGGASQAELVTPAAMARGGGGGGGSSSSSSGASSQPVGK